MSGLFIFAAGPGLSRGQRSDPIGMDNLYISAKFVIFGWRNPDRFMFHGDAQEKGKGVPLCLFQNRETS